MMMRYLNRIAAIVMVVSAAALTACDDFLDVPNVNNLEADAVDPERDASILSLSAYQQFANTIGNSYLHTAWFTNEARVGDTFPTRNDIGRRDIPENNTEGGQWGSLHSVMQYARTTIRSIEAGGNTVDLARAYFTAGYAMLMIGEIFCEGTIAQDWLTPRGPITSAQMADSAVAYLTKANTIAKALTGTAASDIANASMVGIARANLQSGKKAEAAAAAAQVPAAFNFNVLHLDDVGNRGLGNDLWSFSESRISLVVGDEWRDMANCGEYKPGATRNIDGSSSLCPKGSATADPRLSYVDMGRVAQDGVLRFYRQNKIKGWGDPDRLASGLEARYIKAEAELQSNPGQALALINERRAVGKQAPLTTLDPAELLVELMEQRGRDFWLEGKRLGDIRRNGAAVRYQLVPGANTYYKTGLGGVGTQTCWPVQLSEKQNNPNWPK
jgi:starch-binding outer membrane protein, SusD/RagB family